MQRRALVHMIRVLLPPSAGKRDRVCHASAVRSAHVYPLAAHPHVGMHVVYVKPRAHRPRNECACSPCARRAWWKLFRMAVEVWFATQRGS